MDSPSLSLDDSAKKELLLLARSTLEEYLSRGKTPEPNPKHSELQLRCGAFVTLRCGAELRGCIGQIYPEERLFLTVQQCAISSAVQDSRFSPVQYDELEQLTIEISVLAPLRRVNDPSEVQVGIHGLLVSQGKRRGLLLPQVAAENHWDRETFLRQTCLKASLYADAWRDAATTIECFTSQVFSELELGLRGQ